jgi:2-methylcitrate dehydratase PrpD
MRAMIRRDFFKTPLALAGFGLAPASPKPPGAGGNPAAGADEPARAPGLTRSVAEFIVSTRYDDIPADVIALGKKTLLDGFGLALAGSASVVSPVVRQYLGTLGVTATSATIIGTAMKVPPRFAAFANGISIHADDYDDTGSSLHVAAPVLPSAFALAEERGRSGKELMLAFHIGVEAASKIGDAILPRHDREGFHTTGTIGSFGSAAACAKLRGLTVDQTAYALGVAASQASGIRRNFGSMTKAFHAGHAAENGSLAADLAAAGFTAAADVLETPLGFFQAAGGGFDPDRIVNRLGRPWMFASPGDLIKRFPCGTIQQPVMDATLRLVAQQAIKAAEVERVEVAGNQSNVNTLFRHRPATGLEAKFSMEFAVAILLVDGRAGLGQFTDASVKRAEVQDMVARVTFSADPEFDRLGKDGGFQAVLEEPMMLKIHMKDGRVLSTRTEPAKGSPRNPMTFEEVADKFRTNAEFARWPAAKAESIIRQVSSLERASTLAPLTAALAA